MPRQFDEFRTDLKPYGLTCELWQPKRMNRPERHNELEINFLPECSITYLINNQRVEVKMGSMIAFWGLVPHQILDFKKSCPYYVLTIPFSVLKEWELPKPFLDTLFRGKILTVSKFDDLGFEKKRFEKWSSELKQNESELYSASLLEICAYLKRFSFNSLSAKSNSNKISLPPMNLVERMAMFIARNFTQPIKASDVAKEVGLHPDYANSIFKKVFSSTISNYIICQRVAYAEGKLTISNESITSLAYQSGFNSISRFNAAFKKKNKLTPREYRKKKLSTSYRLE